MQRRFVSIPLAQWKQWTYTAWFNILTTILEHPEHPKRYRGH